MKRIGCAMAICLLVLYGCSENQDKKLVGWWQESGNPMGKLEFRGDHTGRAYWPNEQGKQEIEEMKWRIITEQNKVSVVTPPGPVNFDIKNDRLVSPNGVVLFKVK